MRGPHGLGRVIRGAGRSAWLKAAVMIAAAACMIPLAGGMPQNARADTPTFDASQVPSNAEMSNVGGNGLVMGKNVKAVTDGSTRGAQVTLSSYSTGGVKTKATSLPTDAVIGIQYDRSMEEDFAGNYLGSYANTSSRWTAAVKATMDFIQKLHDDTVESVVQHSKNPAIPIRMHRVTVQVISGDFTGDVDAANGNLVTYTSPLSDVSAQKNVDTIATRLGFCTTKQPISNLSVPWSGCPVDADETMTAESMADGLRQMVVLMEQSYWKQYPDGTDRAADPSYGQAGVTAPTDSDPGVKFGSGTPTGQARNKQFLFISGGDMGLDASTQQEYQDAVSKMNFPIAAKGIEIGMLKPGYDATHPDTTTSRGIYHEGQTLADSWYTLSVSDKAKADTPIDDYAVSNASGVATGFNVPNASSRYMQLMSSNYPDATSYTNAGARAADTAGDKSYFQYESTADALDNVMFNIAATGYVNPELGTGAKTEDYASEYFTVPADASGVVVKQETATAKDSNGDPVWGAPEDVPSTVKVDTSVTDGNGNKGVSVTGWDYDGNAVGPKTSGGYGGKRLIVQFTETVNPCFLGGNKVPTNDTQAPKVKGGELTQVSGVSDSQGYYVSSFKLPTDTKTKTVTSGSPTADIKLADNCPATLKDGKAYEGTKLDGSLLGKLVTPDAGRTPSDSDFAKLTYAVERGGSPLGTYDSATNTVTVTGDADVKTPDIKLTLTPTVTANTPSADGSNDTFTGDPVDSTVYVLYPTAKVDDTLVDSGKPTDLSKNLLSWKWDSSKGDISTDDSYTLVSHQLQGASGTDGDQKDMRGTYLAGAVTPDPDPASPSTSFKPTDNTDFTVGIQVKDVTDTTSPAPFLLDVDTANVTNAKSVSDSDISKSVKNSKDGQDSPDFTVYVEHSDPCWLGGSSKPSAYDDATGEGCLGLVDGAVQNGSAYEYAVIGGGDNGKGTAGYSGLIYKDTVAPLLKANPDADLTWTFKAADGSELGSFTIAHGKTFADGEWTWTSGAKDYLEGVGEHKVTVSLTSSTRTDPAAPVWSWTPQVQVYVPQAMVADSVIKLGNPASMSVNMAPGREVNQQDGTDSPLTVTSYQALVKDATGDGYHYETRSGGGEPNGVSWVDGTDDKPSEAPRMLTSMPSTTLKAKELEGDADNCATEMVSADSCKPVKSTTFKVRVDFTNPNDPNDRGSVSNAADSSTPLTGLTNGVSATGAPTFVVVNQHNAFPYNNPQGAFGDVIGVPLKTAENVTNPTSTNAAFTVYVFGKTVTSLPLTGGTGAGLAAVLVALTTLLFGGLIGGGAWLSRRSRRSAHAIAKPLM